MNRYVAIDFYRGLTLALMIVVNSPGSWDHIYAPLDHAVWHGCTPTDLVFPSFMFIIGVSMWFSFAKYNRQWSSALGWKILRRVVVLFLIGLLLNKFPTYWSDWEHWRILGVMQRLALGYGIAALLVLTLPWRALVGVSIGILLGYWAILYQFGLPDVGGPYSLEGNAVLRLDRWLLGNDHLYHGEGVPFDPEGLLSTLPAVVTVLLGWLSGKLMEKRTAQKDLLVRDLLVFGLICGFSGLAWDVFFPINKKIWTSSYVLYAGGISIVMLAASIWLIDVQRWRKGTDFFLVFGANSLFAYVLSGMLARIFQLIQWGEGKNVKWWLYETVFVPMEGKEFSSFMYALFFMLLCWLVCRWLYVRKIHLKI